LVDFDERQTSPSSAEPRRPPRAQVPLFAIGYRGWGRLEALQAHLAKSDVAGILVLDSALFAAKGGRRATGPACLWGLMLAIQGELRSLLSVNADLGAYVR
jgi:hypothetical protein